MEQVRWSIQQTIALSECRQQNRILFLLDPEALTSLFSLNVDIGISVFALDCRVALVAAYVIAALELYDLIISDRF